MSFSRRIRSSSLQHWPIYYITFSSTLQFPHAFGKFRVVYIPLVGEQPLMVPKSQLESIYCDSDLLWRFAIFLCSYRRVVVCTVFVGDYTFLSFQLPSFLFPAVVENAVFLKFQNYNLFNPIGQLLLLHRLLWHGLDHFLRVISFGW